MISKLYMLLIVINYHFCSFSLVDGLIYVRNDKALCSHIYRFIKSEYLLSNIP